MAKILSDKDKLRDFFRNEVAGARDAKPVCRHFGDCGGCEFQDVPYPRQLEAKKKAFAFIGDSVVAEMRAAAAKIEEPADRERALGRAEKLASALAGIVPGVQPGPKPFGYRQRMDYVFAFELAGLRRMNRHRQVVEVEECPLLGDAGFRVFDRARRLAREIGVESYDYLRHHGDLRYFVVRRSRNGQTLLSLVTKTREHGQQIMDILARLHREGVIASGYWLLAEGLGDISFGPPQWQVGQPWIVETMNGIDLRIGPNTFFQSNPDVAEKAYAAIRDFVPPGGRVLDLYSGVGSIALSMAARAGAVTAVENVPDNLTLAEANIGENRVANISLVNADSAVYLRDLALDPSAREPDLLVVNPPRPGVEGDGMRDIARLAPKRFAYMSCNPFTLFRNLADVVGEYSIVDVAIYDMFPQTRHFECLALLERV